MASSGIKFKGAAKLKANMAKIGRQYPTQARSALYEEGEYLLSRSKPLTPKKTGTLRGSGFVTTPFGSGTVKVIVGYGGPASDYALVQHENLSFRHTEGQAKYLEEPFADFKTGFLERLARKIASKVAKVRLST